MKHFLYILFSLALMVGCSNSEEANNSKEADQINSQDIKAEEQMNENEEDNSSDQHTEEKEHSPSQAVNTNKELTKKLEDEKIVATGRVYERNNAVYGTFQVEDNVSDESITKLVDQYANDIQESYKDKQVNVQAIQGGVVVEEKTITTEEPVVNKGEKLAKDLNAEVLNVIIGVYAIKIELEEVKQMNATEDSQLELTLNENDSVTIDFKQDANAFFGTIQGNYVAEDILNSVVSVK